MGGVERARAVSKQTNYISALADACGRKRKGSATISGTVTIPGELRCQPANIATQLQYLLKLTKFGVFRWKRTADRNETFTTTGIHGACVVTVWEEGLWRYFRPQGSDRKIQTLATSADSDVVDALFSEARSRAFDLTRAIGKVVGLLDV
jgi:hypothetical protein